MMCISIKRPYVEIFFTKSGLQGKLSYYTQQPSGLKCFAKSAVG